MSQDPSAEDLWRPIIETDLTDAVFAELNADNPNPAVIGAWWRAMFLDQTGVTIPSTNLVDVALFAKWLGFQAISSDVIVNALRRPYLRHILFDTYSSKVTALAQRPCHICTGARAPSDMFPVSVLPIRLIPRSRQVMDGETFSAFQAAVAHHFEGKSRDFGPTGRFCVAFTFVLKDTGRDRDLDNMVKALQDALSRALGFNDAHIHHLDVIKLIQPADEEYVYFRIAPSALNEHSDVLAHVEHHSWGTAGPLVLEDFLPPAT